MLSRCGGRWAARLAAISKSWFDRTARYPYTLARFEVAIEFVDDPLLARPTRFSGAWRHDGTSMGRNSPGSSARVRHRRHAACVDGARWVTA
jgi:hypothetical protein